MGMMSEFVEQQGPAFHGRHHEICPSDPHRIAPEKLKTIPAMPIAKKKA